MANVVRLAFGLFKIVVIGVVIALAWIPYERLMPLNEWDAVMRVHLKGTYAPSHVAAQYWRDLAKAGEKVDGRIISTSSGSGLFGNPGQLWTQFVAIAAAIVRASRSPKLAARRAGRGGVMVLTPAERNVSLGEEYRRESGDSP